jgi:hypothetical protein
MTKKQVGLLVALGFLVLCVFSCLGVMFLGELQGDEYQAPLPVTLTPTTEPTTTPWVLPTNTLVVPTFTPVPHCICNADVYNCGDPEALKCFTACGSDVHRLDRDGDGVPCE